MGSNIWEVFERLIGKDFKEAGHDILVAQILLQIAELAPTLLRSVIVCGVSTDIYLSF